MVVNSWNYTAIIQFVTIHALIFMSPLCFQSNQTITYIPPPPHLHLPPPPHNNVGYLVTRSQEITEEITEILTTIFPIFSTKINIL